MFGSDLHMQNGLVVPTTLKTLYPVNISLGSLFWEDYQGVFPSVNGGWGPGLLASDGTGYAIRVAGGQGGLFRTLNGVAYGNALVLLGQNSCNDGNQHHFKLGVQYLGLGTSANTFSYHISIYLDANSIPSATYTDTVSTLDPTQVYPSFISDGGNVFLYNWTWYNDDNTPVIGWKVISVRYGDAKPSTIQTASPVFLITSTTTPIAIQPLFVQQRADNRIARMRSNLNLLQRAYF